MRYMSFEKADGNMYNFDTTPYRMLDLINTLFTHIMRNYAKGVNLGKKFLNVKLGVVRLHPEVVYVKNFTFWSE